MKLNEVAVTGQKMYKGRSASPDHVPDNAYDLRVSELENHIEGWKASAKRRPDDLYIKQKIEDLENELDDLKSIGELPFTFYAAKDKDDAHFFSDQFPDGVVDEVKIYANNLATVDDVNALRDENGKRVSNRHRRTVSHLTAKEVHYLKKAGFDGATGYIDQRNGIEVVVFSPEQVKRV